MKKKILILLLFLAVIFPIVRTFREQWHYYLAPFDRKRAENLYGISQYVLTKNASWIADEILFSYTADYYIKGGSPILVNPENPPLAKYIIGLSLKFFNNEKYPSIIFGLLSIISLFLLSRLLIKNTIIALLPVALFAWEKLFQEQLVFMPLFETIALTFLLLIFYFFIKGQKKQGYFVLSNIFLGALWATRPWMATVPLIASFFIYLLLFSNKKNIIIWLLTLPFAVIILLGSYFKLLLDGWTIYKVLSVQKWILWYHQSRLINFGSVFPFIFLNNWYVWWGDKKTLPINQWNIFWPLFTGISLSFSILASIESIILKAKSIKKLTFDKEIMVLCLWIISYFTFLSFGNVNSRYVFYLLPFCYIIGFYFIFKIFKKKMAVSFKETKKTTRKLLLKMGKILINLIKNIFLRAEVLKNNIKNNYLLFIILTIALALRLFHLDFYDFSIDEIYRFAFSKNVTLFNSNNPYDPPLLLLILKYTNLLFGKSDFILRLPSVLFSTLSVLMTYFVAKTIFNKKVGLISAFLLAISCFSIERSQEAKAYSLLTFFPLLSTYALFSIVVNGFKIKKMLLLAVSLLLTVYAAYIGIYPNIIILSYIIILGIKYYLSPKIKINLFIKLSVLSPLIPLLYFILKSFVFNTAKNIYLVPISPSSPNVFTTKLSYLQSIMLVFSNFALISYLPFFLIAFIFSFIQFKKKFTVWIYFYLWIFSFLALRILFLIYSPFQETLPQYYIYVLPFYLIMVAVGIVYISESLSKLFFLSKVKIVQRFFIIFSIILLIAMSAPALWNYYFLPQRWRADWKSSSRYLEINSQPDDVLVSPSRQINELNFISFYFDHKKYGVNYSIFPLKNKKVNWYVYLVGNYPYFEDWAVSDMVHPGKRAYPSWVFQLSYIGKGKKVSKMQNKSNWKIFDSSNSKDINKAIDGDKISFWRSSSSLERGDFVEIDTGKESTLVWIEIEFPINYYYLKDYLVETSLDGKNWEIVQSVFHSDDPCYYPTSFTPFKPVKARFIKLKNLLRDKYTWQINEINIYEVVDQKIPNLYKKNSLFTGLVVEDKDAKEGFAKFVPKSPPKNKEIDYHTPYGYKMLQYGEEKILSKGFWRAKFRAKTDNIRGKFYTEVTVGFAKEGSLRPQPVRLISNKVNHFEEYFLDFYSEGDVPIVLMIISRGERNYWFDYPEFTKLK